MVEYDVKDMVEELLGMYVDGDIPRASPRGLASPGLRGFNGSPRSPLHDNVRLECGGKEPLPFVVPRVPMFGKDSVLGCLCIASDGGPVSYTHLTLPTKRIV